MRRPTPICVEHRLEMRCAENEVLVADGFANPFQVNSSAKSHSTFWYGDLFECPHPDCSAAIVTGFGAPMHPDSDGPSQAQLELLLRGLDERDPASLPLVFGEEVQP